jgi:hypothetical protein
VPALSSIEVPSEEDNVIEDVPVFFSAEIEGTKSPRTLITSGVLLVVCLLFRGAPPFLELLEAVVVPGIGRGPETEKPNICTLPFDFEEDIFLSVEISCFNICQF